MKPRHLLIPTLLATSALTGCENTHSTKPHYEPVRQEVSSDITDVQNTVSAEKAAAAAQAEEEAAKARAAEDKARFVEKYNSKSHKRCSKPTQEIELRVPPFTNGDAENIDVTVCTGGENHTIPVRILPPENWDLVWGALYVRSEAPMTTTQEPDHFASTLDMALGNVSFVQFDIGDGEFIVNEGDPGASFSLDFDGQPYREAQVRFSTLRTGR